ncbi:hypothetical protein Zmor_016884 [Zophobas morio]|uniref:Cyclic nucleotide-binding domain-containing protein n=1 Tax=Zophobas morio TaxID=2755281 RepID=A0AA38I7E3_9CUCU|nr:hypothetical protein Zmor_016884 [Zophobas morio]
MNIRVKHRFHHGCTLDARSPMGTKHRRSPYSTFLAKFVFWLRGYLTISWNDDSRLYFRSFASYTKERQRHLTNPSFKWVIHPFSRFERRKNIVMTVMWLFFIFFESFVGTFHGQHFYSDERHEVHSVILFVNLVFFGDLVVRFFTGYTEEKTRTVNLNRRNIAHQYLKTFFFFDGIATVSYFLFYFIGHRDSKIKFFIYHLSSLRAIRLITVVKNISRVLSSSKLQETTRVPLILILTALLFLHCDTCLSGYVSYHHQLYHLPTNKSWLEVYKNLQQKNALLEKTTTKISTMSAVKMYLLHLLVVSCHFFGAHAKHLKTQDSIEMFMYALISMKGLSFYLYCLARILQLFGILNLPETQLENLRMQTDNYMCQKNFQQSLKRRINKYYNYKFSHKFFSEQLVLSTLSDHLKMEVLLYSCHNLIEEVHIFQGLSRSAVGCMLALLKQEIFVPGDQILHSKEDAGCLYFILFGTCAISTMWEQEVLHIEDGYYFGNVLNHAKYNAKDIIYTITALEMVEVYKLEAEDFLYCCKTYPEIQQKMDKAEKLKYRRYGYLFIKQPEADTTGGILQELREGKILEQGLMRTLFT